MGKKVVLIRLGLLIIIVLLFSFAETSFATNIPKHGTGNPSVKIKALGTGTDALPWIPVMDIENKHTQALDLRFIKAIGAPTTLSVDADPDDMTITVASTTGFTAGVVVGIFSGTGEFYFGKQIGAPAGNVITLDTPIDRAHVIGNPVIAASDDMAVNGSVTTQIFQIGPIGTDIVIDITRLVGYIQSGSAMDDALFGNIVALTNGVVLRRNDGVIDNIWNVKSNGEIALLSGADLGYTTKAPAGSFGARFRNSYAGQEKHGVTIRVGAGEMLEVLIQDDLTGLEEFRMMAQGHVLAE